MYVGRLLSYPLALAAGAAVVVVAVGMLFVVFAVQSAQQAVSGRRADRSAVAA